MQIVEVKTSLLVPYARNPRKNENAVPMVRKSIEQFGFKVPIVIDKNNVVVAGHTRLLVAKELRMQTVPCIVADDLTEEQINAFRLVDNKVSEYAEWDDSLLKLELDDFSVDTKIMLTDIGFDVDFQTIDLGGDGEEQEGKVNERERTMDAYNLHDFDPTRCVGEYQMPFIHKVDYKPRKLIGFNYVLSTEPTEDVGVHFFIDDYQFERVWNNPQEYLAKLTEYGCVLTPDFSLYTEMPMAMKIWNVYRSRLIGQMLQDRGAIVIPTLSWCEEATFDFCFDGIDTGGTVAVSTIGVKRDAESFLLWKRGMDEAIRQCEPSRIIVYGGKVEYEYPCEVVYVSNEVTERMKGGG